MNSNRILVVEDEVMVAMTLEDTLEALGYEVVGTTDNGKDAVRLAGEKTPDLILMDIRIRGDIDGIEAAEKISEDYDIPVVFLTAHSDEQTLMRALKTQPYGFLIKPFRERELYSNIEMAIHKHRVLKKRGYDAVAPASSVPDRTFTPEPVHTPPRNVPAERTGVGGDSAGTIEHTVVESLENPIFVLNRDLKIVLYNRRFTELCNVFDIPEMYFRASPEKAGVFSLLGDVGGFLAVFRGAVTTVELRDVRDGDREYRLKITKIPLRDSSGIFSVLVVVDDATYEKKLKESSDLYHKTAEGVIELSSRLRQALGDHEDPLLHEIADTSDDMVLRFSNMDEEWLRIRNEYNAKKVWER